MPYLIDIYRCFEKGERAASSREHPRKRNYRAGLRSAPSISASAIAIAWAAIALLQLRAAHGFSRRENRRRLQSNLREAAPGAILDREKGKPQCRRKRCSSSPMRRHPILRN
jgi:hypothetical protein